MKNTWNLINEATYATKKDKTPIYCIQSNSTNTLLTNKIDILNEFNCFLFQY